MANWASTSYAIEGNEKTLQWIYDAIIECQKDKHTPEVWEVDVCLKLGIPQDDIDKVHLRGKILDVPSREENGVIEFSAEEAWGVQDLDDLLVDKFKDIKVFWITQEEGNEVFQTNDGEGKYFADRFFVDTCISGDYQSDYFRTKDAAYKWVSELTNGQVFNEELVENFNLECQQDDFIYVHEFEVI